ncbi:MAG: ADP-ribosylglycohydrolase family protein [Erysipelotrichaceae bacterium]|nr:ADP-ribosylglycohydrolase family protein [Erysipelotrichaceae bacterium]
MLGAIFGDIVGSVYEFHNTHDYNFKLLSKRSEVTDDTVMTLAVAKAMIESAGKSDEEIRDALIDTMKELGRRYPNAGYGGMFYHWVLGKDRKPYNSFGNGSAMRVSSIGWLYESLDEVEHAAKLSAEVTHNHPEGIKGAQATAGAIYLARMGSEKEEIREYVEKTYGYDLNKTMKDIVSRGHGEEICQISVPQALVCFLLSDSYIDCIRKSVSIGGDSDTIACIAGGIAEAYYGFPEEYVEEVFNRLDDYQRDIVDLFVNTVNGDPDNLNVFFANNHLLEETIDKFRESDPDKADITDLYDVMVDLMLDQAQVLIPAVQTAAGDGSYNLIELENDKGDAAIPVFTSRVQIDDDYAEAVMIANFLDDIIRQLLDNDRDYRLLINRGAHQLVLARENLQELYTYYLIRKHYARTPSDDFRYVNVKEVPEELLDAVSEYIRQSIPEIRRAWYAKVDDLDRIYPAFVIDCDEDDREDVFDMLETFMFMMKAEKPWLYIPAPDQPDEQTVEFYVSEKLIS